MKKAANGDAHFLEEFYGDEFQTLHKLPGYESQTLQPVATAFADTLGFYAIIEIPAGTYSISATKDGYYIVPFEGVNIIAGNKTLKNFELIKK